VLVFGDSWGAYGPSWLMLQHMFERRGIASQIVSTAVSGTRACQWSIFPENLAVAAALSFGDSGPDFVWLTLGGNDLLDEPYTQCSLHAQKIDGAKKCAARQAEKSASCNIILLERLYARFPGTRVVQCGYDYQCAEGNCVPFTRWPFCGGNIHCANTLGRHWAHVLARPLLRRFNDSYAVISVEGCTQQAGNIPGASLNHPVMDQGSPCYLMLGCEHPAPNSPAEHLIGEAFWELYFKGRVAMKQKPRQPDLSPSYTPPHGWENQTNTEIDDMRCNQNWVPNLADNTSAPPPCDRTLYNYLN